ncbi:MAG: carbon storage regulator CsrA [Thermoguttaceae bacterium]
MLVLSRKLNESIVINDNVVITVLGVKGETVRLGINAPGEIPVHRQEVYEKMQNEEIPVCIG